MNIHRTLVALICVALTACGPSATASPAVPTKDAPEATATVTLTPSPTSTLIPSPTLIPPTATFGPPAPVQNFYVKKARCMLFKPTPGNPTYRVELWYKLGWQDMSENEDGFWLYRDGNRVAELPANTTEYIDIFELVKGGRMSTYYIVAFNSAGETKSNVLSHPNPC